MQTRLHYPPARALCRLGAIIAMLLALSAPASAQFLTIIEPNGGETYTAGVSTVTVSWLEAGIDSDDRIRVEYTVDGTSWSAIDSVGPDVRSISWVPRGAGTRCRVRISSAKDATVSDVSDADFTIVIDTNRVTKVYAPNGGETWRAGEIRTIGFRVPTGSTSVLIELSTNGGATWTEINTVPATTTQYQWGIPDISAQEITTALVRVSVAEALEHSDVSDAAFTIRPRLRPTLTVVAPNGGERFRRDSLTTVRWTTENVPEDGPEVNVEYSIDSGRTWTLIATEDAASGSHAWLVPNRPTKRALVRVVSADRSLGDTSNAVFEILRDSVVTPPGDTTHTIALVDPNGAATWLDGELRRIVWTSTATDDTVVVEALLNGASLGSTTLALSEAPVASEAISWIVPRLADSLVTARIVVRLRGAGTADTSEAITIVHRAIAGINDDSGALSVQVYPNPAHDRLEVRADGDGAIRLFTADGRLARSAQLVDGRASLALDELGAGRYVLEVGSRGHRRHVPVVIAR